MSVKEGLEKLSSSQMRLMFLMHGWEMTFDYGEGVICEAKNWESNVENFLSTVKAVLNEGNSDIGHNFHESEKDLLKLLDEKMLAVHDALCDSFNTPKAMIEIKSLVTIGNQYYNEKMKKKEKCNSQVLVNVGKYITKMMRIFGVFRNDDNVIGSFNKNDDVSGNV
jgi:cysteinyl-tRNA synthetase